jgi:hypothetical protein
MLTASWLKELLGPDFNFYLLAVVLGILAIGVVASLVVGRRHPKQESTEQLSERQIDETAETSIRNHSESTSSDTGAAR